MDKIKLIVIPLLLGILVSIGIIISFNHKLIELKEEHDKLRAEKLSEQKLLEENEILKEKINYYNQTLEEKRAIITAQKDMYDMSTKLFIKHSEDNKKDMIAIAENRIKYLHDKAMPNNPLSKETANKYANWSYELSREKNIPMFWMLSFAGYETNWVSDIKYDGGESWGPFSMQISTIQNVLGEMGYDIPDEPLEYEYDLHQTKRYENFINEYKWKLLDRNLNAKKLFFEVAATYMKQKYEEYNDYVLATLAYNKGSHNYNPDTVFHHYANLVMGEYIILENTLQNKD